MSSSFMMHKQLEPLQIISLIRFPGTIGVIRGESSVGGGGGGVWDL